METIYSWKFDDNKNRSSTWYIIALSVVIWLAIWGFLTRQYGMSFIVILIAWVTYFLENNSDDEVEVFISELWIWIGGSFYDFSKIDNFSFIYDWNLPLFLRLNINKVWINTINLKIDEKIAIDLKNILPNFLTENPKWEITMIEKITNKLKL